MPRDEVGVTFDERFTRRCSHLVSRHGSRVSSWQLDDGVAAILSLFDQPRRCSDVVEWLRDAAGVEPSTDAFFADLVEQRVLVAEDEAEAS